MARPRHLPAHVRSRSLASRQRRPPAPCQRCLQTSSLPGRTAFLPGHLEKPAQNALCRPRPRHSPARQRSSLFRPDCCDRRRAARRRLCLSRPAGSPRWPDDRCAGYSDAASPKVPCHIVAHRARKASTCRKAPAATSAAYSQRSEKCARLKNHRTAPRRRD